MSPHVWLVVGLAAVGAPALLCSILFGCPPDATVKGGQQ